MNAKEKAEELESKFYKALQYDAGRVTRHRLAKQCAIIAVEELIKNSTYPTPEVTYNYLNEVLTELERM